jgi:hypothetical protein
VLSAAGEPRRSGLSIQLVICRGELVRALRQYRRSPPSATSLILAEFAELLHRS